MSGTMNSDFWLNGKSDGRRFALALGIGFVLEAGALAVLLPIMTHQQPPPSMTQTIVKLSIVAPAPAAPKPPPMPKPKQVVPPKQVTPPPLPPPPPLPVAPPLPPPPPIPVAPNRPVIHHPPRPRHITPPPVQPPPLEQAPPTPQPPPPPAAPPAPSAGEQDIFRAEMQRAVQEAAVTPQAAELSREAGVARVSFTYVDGVASGIEVVGSSGFPLLDEAAMQAVRDARLPAPPPDFAGRSVSVVVDVIFHLTATDVDGD